MGMENNPSLDLNIPFYPIHETIGGENQPPLTAWARRMVGKADAVFGRDVDSQEAHLFFGEAALRNYAEGKRPKLTVIGFDLDFDSDEPEWLAAMVEALKGTCEYRDNGDDGDGERLTLQPL